MAEILPIHGGSVPGEPQAEIVTELERLLEDARRGELVGLAFATVRVGDLIGAGWHASTGGSFLLGTAISVLQYQYTQALIEN